MVKKSNLVTTLVTVFSEDGSQILLGMKKRGFGEGRWNGFGGKVREGETIEEAAHREVVEEIGVNVENLQKRGVIVFYEADPLPFEVHIFSTDKIIGTPKESGEMRPDWFDVDNIPYDLMWPDDKYWLPMLMDGKNFKGSFWFKDPQNTNIITKYELSEVKS